MHHPVHMTVDKKADSIPTVGTACEWQPSVVAEMVGIDVAAATAPRALKHGSTEPGSGLQKLQRDDQRAAQDLEELSETRAYKAAMLMDAASMASLSKGGTTQTKAAQLRLLETELSAAAAQRDLMKRVALSAEARQHAEEEKANEQELRAEAAEGAVAALEARMDAQPLGRNAQPPDKQRELARLISQAQVARAAAIAQRHAADREREVYLHAKREAERAERDCHAETEVLEELSLERVEQEASRASAAHDKMAVEASVAIKMESHHRARANDRGQARRELREKAHAQRKAAKAARSAAAERANRLVRDAEPALKEVMRIKEEARAQRVEAILQLKSDTEAAASLIRGSNERRSAERARKDAAHEAEREQLAAKGLNPYKVFKQRDVDRRAVQEETRQENAIRRRKEELAGRLQEENTLRQKQDARERTEREHEQRFRKELGKHVTDARNREYLRARTVDGTDVLDPTGRTFRVEPSQVTNIKDAAFGLGYHPRKTHDMADAVVDLVAAKPRHAGAGTGEFTRLVPHHYVDTERSNTAAKINDHSRTTNAAADGAQALNPRAGDAREGEDQLLEELVPPAGKISLPGTEIEFVDEGGRRGGRDGRRGGGGEGTDRVEGEGGGDPAGVTGGVGASGRELSRFERQALERARQRQRDRLEAGEPQMAAGRVFQDRPAFVSKPERVVFTDFTVGKVHRRRVVLTNVSLTFNTFKVLEMPDEITRFFRVTYSKPGRLSAGMTCAVDIVFIPKVDEDIFTELPIRTQTGRLSIPVVCTARRVKPSLSTNLVVFQGTVTGEKETARVVVTNTGAIPTRFTIQDISPAVPGSPPSSPPLLPSAKLQQTPEPTPAQQIPNDGNDNSIAAAFNGDLQPEELPEDHMKEGKDGDPSSGVALRDALPKTEGQLLARTAAIRNAALRHKEGRAEIEVHAGEGGSGGEGGMAGQAGGKVGAYESSEIVVTFAPLNVGEFRVVKIIKFEGSLDEFRLVVEASSAPVAVFPEEPSTDLRCCVVGKLYIKKIRIRNRGKIAMKVVARVPSCLRHCATFSPDMGFVQPDSNFEFGLRFRPDDDCLARCVRDGWGVQLPQQRDHLKAIRSTEADRCIPRDNEGTQEEEADAAGGHGAGGIIAVPVRVDIPGQAFPARLTLLSRISGWKVEVECGSALGDGSIENGHSDDARAKRGDSEGEEVKFGPCFVGQSVVKRVSLRNTSQLPLKFGFMSNPAEVMIQPADGFGALLPGEQRWIQAVFSPTSAVAHNSTLTFRTSMGQTTSMRCRGCGIDPVVSISHTVLNMAPACPGDTVTTSVFVRNVSTVEQQLEFLAPEPQLSFLKILPSVVHLSPAAGARIEVQFCPPGTRSPETSAVTGDLTAAATVNHDPDTAGGLGAPTSSDGAVVGNAKSTKSIQEDVVAAGERCIAKAAPDSGLMLDGDEGSIVDVPLFVGEVQESRAQDSNLGASAAGVAGVDTDMLGSRSGTCGGSDVEPWSRHGKWKVPCFVKPVEGRNQLPPLALEVTTVTVKRFLSVDKSRVEFGQLAVGSKAVITLRVRNMGDDDVPVEGTGLNTVGPFEVVNAFRPLRARGGTHRCLLQFRPERAGIVSEILVLSSPLIGKSIRIPVRGEGVSPVLRMEPADGRLEMGHVLEGDIVERTVTLHNDSIFPLQYTTASWGPAPTDNYNHMKNFALVPCEGGVPAGESVTVKATFGPDHGRLWPFLAAYRIEARDQPDGGHVLRVRGRCVSRQLYVESAWPGLNPGDQVPAATEDALTPHPRDHTTATPARNTMGLQATTTPILPILLRFPKDSEDADPVGGGSGAAEAGDKSAPPLPATMTLVVGSVNTNDPKKASAGSFEVELSAEAKEAGYFRITPDKGIVAPGAKVEVTCAFEPPPLPPRTPGPAGGKRGAQEVGQWYRTAAMIHLRGGYRPLGSSEVHTVQVQLEGFVTA